MWNQPLRTLDNSLKKKDLQCNNETSNNCGKIQKINKMHRHPCQRSMHYKTREGNPLCVNYKYEDDTALYSSVTSPNIKKINYKLRKLFKGNLNIF